MVKGNKPFRGTGARRTLAKVRRDLKMKTKHRPAATRRNATIVLAQGAAAVPRRNFGTSTVSNGRKNMSVASMVKCLDARVPKTLGLPRAVGPYTVIRTSTLHQSRSNFVMFCPFTSETAAQNAWLNWCGVESIDSTDPVNAPTNTRPILMPLQSLGSAAEVVPAAMTVQVMNPNSLQTADGVFAMTRVNQQMTVGGATYSYDELIQRVVSFYTPRLLTGGKLALRGVKCNSYPLNMNEYADFQSLVTTSTAPFTWDTGETAEDDSRRQPSALAPIVFVQNNTSPATLEFLVTIEWRVRFDPGNPATASHVHHDTLSDEAWNAVVKTMSAVGHGVEELTEDIAEMGALAYGAERFAALL